MSLEHYDTWNILQFKENKISMLRARTTANNVYRRKMDAGAYAKRRMQARKYLLYSMKVPQTISIEIFLTISSFPRVHNH